MDAKKKKVMDEEEKPQEANVLPFPDDVLERVLSFVKSRKDRSAVSLVCKGWYTAERWTRTHVFIGNCYSVSPEIVARRFLKVRSLTIKGKPRISDFSPLPPNWGADIHPWLVAFASGYPFLEELRLKRMTVSDESLDFLARSFPGFKALSLVSCDGFSTDGLASIASYCRSLVELDLQENAIDDLSGSWLSYFPESSTSLEVLNFANLCSDVDFDALERLVARCTSLKVLKVNKNVSLEQLHRLLVRAPQLTDLGTGSFLQDHMIPADAQLESVFSNCKNLCTLSGFWAVSSLHLPLLYPQCSNLSSLNLSYAPLRSTELAKFLPYCPLLRRLWVLDTVEDEGLQAVGSCCPLLEELRVFPANPFDDEPLDGGDNGVTESGFVAVSEGCPNLHYVLYFCRRMTNTALASVVRNCPNFTHFRLCIMNMSEPDYLTAEPMDEGFGAVVKSCPKLRRLAVSCCLTDRAFEYVGTYAKNLETLSIAFAGSSDMGLRYVLEGCPKLRKVEIRDSSFGDLALLSGLDRYESMRSLWMSDCNVTMRGCQILARKMPRLNVEVIREDERSGTLAEKVYVYRSVTGPRRDAPPFVLTL